MFKDSLVIIYFRSFSEGTWVDAVVLSDSSSKFIQRVPSEGLEGEIKEDELSYLTEHDPGEKLLAQMFSLLEMHLYRKSMTDFEVKDDGYYHYVESTVGESEYGGESYESSDLIISEGLLVPLLQKMMNPEFSVSSKMGTVVTEFQFDALASITREYEDAGLKFRWDFESDGTWDTDFSSNSVISHTYETTGIKRVKLEIKDKEGLRSSEIKDIEVLEVQALFTSNLVVGDVSTTFEFDASTSSTKNGSSLSYRWDFEGDGVWDTEFGADKKITHQYKKEGVMPLRLEVNNSEGNTNVKTSQVVVSKFDSLTDVDGNTYRVFKMAGKWWMLDNLKVKHYNNGENIITGLDFKTWGKTRDGAFASYDNDSANITKYGLLYNYYTVENKNKIAPKGWHVATSDEWEELGNYFERLNLVNMLDATINKKSKARNLGFLKTYGGKVNVGFGGVKFEELDSKTYFWASSDGSNYAKYNSIEYSGSYKKSSGLSIRCVKD
jgi:uncharacterized protein (TIGR02145 family)